MESLGWFPSSYFLKSMITLPYKSLSIIYLLKIYIPIRL